MINSNKDNNQFIDLNIHTIITKDYCIHMQKLCNSSKIKGNYISILNNYGEGKYYAHVFNPNFSNFPLDINIITVDTCDTYLHDLYLGILLGF